MMIGTLLMLGEGESDILASMPAESSANLRMHVRSIIATWRRLMREDPAKAKSLHRALRDGEADSEGRESEGLTGEGS